MEHTDRIHVLQLASSFQLPCRSPGNPQGGGDGNDGNDDGNYDDDDDDKARQGKARHGTARRPGRQLAPALAGSTLGQLDG